MLSEFFLYQRRVSLLFLEIMRIILQSVKFEKAIRVKIKAKSRGEGILSGTLPLIYPSIISRPQKNRISLEG